MGLDTRPRKLGRYSTGGWGRYSTGWGRGRYSTGWGRGRYSTGWDGRFGVQPIAGAMWRATVSSRCAL
jgi:hypothetical protein